MAVRYTPGTMPDREKNPPVLNGLRVDLSGGSATYERQPADVRRAVLGGRGLGAYLLLSERAYEVDPLCSANPLVFSIGPLTGTGAPSATRYNLTSRSPLTGTIFDGNSGGSFGSALRRIGLDYLVVTGACAEPSYLHIGDRGMSLLPADDLWGLDVPATLARLGELHEGCEAAVIGPAGERGVLFASVATKRNRHVGRGGLGAVMGAKRMKALVLDPPDAVGEGPADAEGFDALVSEASDLLRSSPVTSLALPEFGTSVLLNMLNQLGVLPTRNFSASRFEFAEMVSGEALRESFVVKPTACEGCFVGCARHTRSSSGAARGPEYESLWALGADCGIGDLAAIVEANDACNRLCLDTITMGATIACAMDLTSRGILPDGPRFGDAAALLELVSATAFRQGLGDELAEGSRRFAARHGREELAMQVKGLEMPAFDPRGMTGQGLAFATSNRGACHSRANMLSFEVLGVPKLIDRFAVRGKAGPLIHLQNLNAVLDSLMECKFAAHVLNPDHFSRLLAVVTGESMETQELLRAGERIWNLERLFNLRAGFTRADDTLPPRMLCEPVTEGPSQGHVVELAPMLDEYYVLRGWDAEGVPTSGTLADLGIAPPIAKATSAIGPPLALCGTNG